LLALEQQLDPMGFISWEESHSMVLQSSPFFFGWLILTLIIFKVKVSFVFCGIWKLLALHLNRYCIIQRDRILNIQTWILWLII
jgi:hypothetical protein